MNNPLFGILAVLAIGVAPAAALTQQECSAKYNAAKQAGTLNGAKWNEFRKSECGEAPAQPTAAAPAAAPAAATPPAAPSPAAAANTAVEAPKPAAVSAPATPAATTPAPAAAAPTPAAIGAAVFPKAVDPKYTKETGGKARMKTCADQYNVNKSNGGNAGLSWIAKGGGYYSECNKRLKG